MAKDENICQMPCKEHSGFEAKINTLVSENTDQWEAINKLRNRPPIWATVIISLLTFALGASLTYASLAAKIAAVVP